LVEWAARNLGKCSTIILLFSHWVSSQSCVSYKLALPFVYTGLQQYHHILNVLQIFSLRESGTTNGTLRIHWAEHEPHSRSSWPRIACHPNKIKLLLRNLFFKKKKITNPRVVRLTLVQPQPLPNNPTVSRLKIKN